MFKYVHCNLKEYELFKPYQDIKFRTKVSNTCLNYDLEADLIISEGQRFRKKMNIHNLDH